MCVCACAHFIVLRLRERSRLGMMRLGCWSCLMPASSTALGLLLCPWAACPTLDTFGQKVQSALSSSGGTLQWSLLRLCWHQPYKTGVDTGCPGNASVVWRQIRLSDLWRIRTRSSYGCYFHISPNVMPVLRHVNDDSSPDLYGGESHSNIHCCANNSVQ